ncbi:MAG: hypothetical protein HW387_1562 [Parachlamydiales bacterium]|nr:hypothetical protein [Parachlamydiales bacterium]
MQMGNANPWFSMWKKPRTTIRSIVQVNPRYGVVYLATAYALQNLFYFANVYSVGHRLGFFAVLIPMLVLAPIVGMAWLYYSGWVFYITGRWLGGIAPAVHLRAVVAWSNVPTILTVAMWCIFLLTRAESVFLFPMTGPTLVFVNLIILILGVWTFVLFLQSLREVQGFSLGRALANLLLAGTVSGAIIFLAAMAVGMMIGLFL